MKALTWAVLLSALATAPAVAQSSDQRSAPPDIVIEAPRSVPVPTERSAYTGAPIVVTTVRIPVWFWDLDLRDPASEPNLMFRIRRVAQDACAALDRLYPLNPDPDCVDKTVAKATPGAKALLTAVTR